MTALIFHKAQVDANALVITLVPRVMAIFLGKSCVTRALRDPVAIASNHVHTCPLWNLAAPLEMGEANGRRHDQMPRDGTRHPHGHRRRPQELRGHAGFFRARILSDLSDRARVVRQGSLGVRSRAAPTTRRPLLNSTILETPTEQGRRLRFCPARVLKEPGARAVRGTLR